MKRIIIVFALFLLTLSLTAGDRKVIDEVVVRINNEILTRGDLERERQALHRQLSQQGLSGEELEKTYQEELKNMLRNMIDQALLVQHGINRGYSVAADVIRQLDRVRQDMGLATMEDLERAMLAQGTTMEDVKQQWKEQRLAQLVIQRDATRAVLVNDDEVQAYYEEHQEELVQPESIRLREILISTATRSRQEAEDRTREVIVKIRQGESFEALALEYSDAPTAENGGDLGAFEPGKLSQQVQELIQNLLEGGVADPKLTAEGYLILKLDERHAGGVPPLEKVRDQIVDQLYFGRAQPALRTFLDKLRGENYVFVKAGYTDTGAIPEEEKPILRGRRRRRAVGQN